MSAYLFEDQTIGRLAKLNKIMENSLDKIIVAKMSQKCPVCGSNKIATYLRGMTLFSKKLQKDIDEGKIILGGCIVSGDDPFCICTDCNTEFYKQDL